jgi:valyl-tRNA synthetase
MPIVQDTMVDIAFGTGVVKITPAHDANDFEVGEKHALDFINIFNDNGTLNDNAGPEFKVSPQYLESIFIEFWQCYRG